jgi:hypothetical protein
LDPQFFTHFFKRIGGKLRVDDERRDDAGLSGPAVPGSKHPLQRNVLLMQSSLCSSAPPWCLFRAAHYQLTTENWVNTQLVDAKQLAAHPSPSMELEFTYGGFEFHPRLRAKRRPGPTRRRRDEVPEHSIPAFYGKIGNRVIAHLAKMEAKIRPIVALDRHCPLSVPVRMVIRTNEIDVASSTVHWKQWRMANRGRRKSLEIARSPET